TRRGAARQRSAWSRCRARGAARRLDHDPDGGPGRVAQRGDGGDRRVLRSGAPAGRRRWRTMTLAELEAILSDADADVFALAGVESRDPLAAAERALVGRGSPMSRAKQSIKDLDPSERPLAGKALEAFTARVA